MMSDTSFNTSSSSNSLDSEDVDIDYEALMKLVDEDEHYDDYDDVFYDSNSTNDSNSTETPSPSAEAAMVTKRKRIRNRRRIYAPRIVKNDVRRHYATMMVNVFNSFDERAMESFFRTFAVPNMRVRKFGVLELSTNPVFQQQFRNNVIEETVVGIQWAAMHFLIMKAIVPDQILQIESARLLSRSDTEKTMLEVDVRFNFTRLHDVHPLLLTDDMFEKLVLEDKDSTLAGDTKDDHICATFTHTQHSLPPISDLKNKVDPFQYYQSKVGKEMPLLMEPEQVSFIGSMRWYINEKKQLEMFEILSAKFV